MKKRLLSDIDLQGKRVLMRVDFNVPLHPDGTISDDTRIRASLPSIEYALKRGGRLILMSHLGRPRGVDPHLSLRPIAERLSTLLHRPVPLAPDCIGPEVEILVQRLAPGDVLLLENLRFHSGEETPDLEPLFASQLAALGDLYVNDAFGTAHRAHASTALVPALFPGRSVAGFLMQKEIDHLAPLLGHPPRPFYAILGGAKVSTKAGVIRNLLPKVDALFLGGGMALTFLKARGVPVGDSLVESSAPIPPSPSLVLPVDLVIADAFSNDAQTRIIPAEQGIPPGWRGMDVGPQTIAAWVHTLRRGATIFWNGPLGVFEMPRFAAGTRSLAEALTHVRGQVIVGGGDSVAAVQQMGFGDRFAHLSTGGGATLEWIEQGHLPGIDALTNQN